MENEIPPSPLPPFPPQNRERGVSYFIRVFSERQRSENTLALILKRGFFARLRAKKLQKKISPFLPILGRKGGRGDGGVILSLSPADRRS